MGQWGRVWDADSCYPFAMPDEEAPQPPDRPLAVRIFIGPYGLRPGWRFALFIAVLTVFALAGTLLLQAPLQRVLRGEGAGALREGLFLLYLFATMWIMSRVDQQPLSSFGLGGIDRLRNFLLGGAAGFGVLSLLMGALVAARVYHFGPPVLHGSDLLLWSLGLGLAFVFVGFFEELLMRGCPLFALSQGIGFWPAAIALSILFGAGHIGNRGEEILGIGNAMLAGLVFAYSLRWSGSLWWAIGCHITWDWGESFFYGVADSGNVSTHHFLSGTPSGAGWLSGGTVGPEGSVLTIAALLLLAVIVRLTIRKHAAPGLGRRRPVTSSPSSLTSNPSTPPVLPPEERESDSGHPA